VLSDIYITHERKQKSIHTYVCIKTIKSEVQNFTGGNKTSHRVQYVRCTEEQKSIPRNLHTWEQKFLPRNSYQGIQTEAQKFIPMWKIHTDRGEKIHANLKNSYLGTKIHTKVKNSYGGQKIIPRWKIHTEVQKFTPKYVSKASDCPKVPLK
jgi:hypothetical protein